MSGTGRRTLGEVWHGLGYPRGGPGQIDGLLDRSRTGRGTVGEVQDGSENRGEVLDG